MTTIKELIKEAEKKFVGRNKDKFMRTNCLNCQWCGKRNIPVYDVIGIAMCEDCINRITRLNKKNGDIRVRLK